MFNMKIISRGIIYGIFSILPGLSGGSLANYTGDYDKIIKVLNNKEDYSFIINIILGFTIGVILTSNIILIIYHRYSCIFIKVIILINSFIIITMIMKTNNKINITLFSFLLYLLINTLNININLSGIALYIISGIIYSFSKVIPGISSTSLLLTINFYDDIILFFSKPFYSFYNNMIYWIIFWIIFVLFSYLLIGIINKINNKNLFNKIVIILMINNVLSLI